ncbi:MAG TPA: 1,2-phenylacetyl-CoA epoxidase subunit PaaD [Steroidobacteraceae bacterium]|nr:1,2-phenylacetyl-CoA epoxidase subunit PaaD [Steroidobacteraceae bacterium]
MSVRSPAGDTGAAAREARAWAILEDVPDPEIPVLSITDLGIVRYVRCDADGQLHVGLTPTYSGCPATEVIRQSVRAALQAHGCADVQLEEVLSPPWSSDWVSAAGRAKLTAFGIAPPATAVSSPRQLRGTPRIACPRCASPDTERISEFGSTPCKAHYRCASCGEPFDYFKCI